ncbi:MULTISPECIES: type IV pilus biogenesis/stability protein PilW [Marinobacter]|uniref:type IV pilus biogenesis/stability protein PilW n=1 Tax=Marinobacter TaxID=2742 RepID=UPI002AF6C8E7|nr:MULTISPECIES: type IV pilus biogenesis/stability protein PilW [Marinobacter]
MKLNAFPSAVVRAILMVGLLASSAGCVTTTNSPFAKDADQQKAEESYVRLGLAYIGQGHYDRARDRLQRALDIDSDSPGALAGMGLVYQSEGEPELAEKAFRRALSSDSSYTRGRIFYGAFLYNQGRYEEAEEQFQRASQDVEYTERASIFYNLGRAQEQQQDYPAAAKSYKRAVNLSRGKPDYLLALSSLLLKADDYNQASIYYRQLTTVMDRNPNLQHSPESLLTGLRLAHYFGDSHREASLALLLRNQYPESEQLKQYRALISND